MYLLIRFVWHKGTKSINYFRTSSIEVCPLPLFVHTATRMATPSPAGTCPKPYSIRRENWNMEKHILKWKDAKREDWARLLKKTFEIYSTDILWWNAALEHISITLIWCFRHVIDIIWKNFFWCILWYMVDHYVSCCMQENNSWAERRVFRE